MMSSRALRVKLPITVGLVAIFLQGCVATEHSTDSATYCGTVLDTEARTPVQKAKVELYSGRHSATSRSDTNGFFWVGPLTSYHVTVAIPPEGVLVGGGRESLSDLLLTISAKGYGTTQFWVAAHSTNRWTDEIHLGNILLKRGQKK
jgi:hypothetical protein